MCSGYVCVSRVYVCVQGIYVCVQGIYVCVQGIYVCVQGMCECVIVTTSVLKKFSMQIKSKYKYNF